MRAPKLIISLITRIGVVSLICAFGLQLWQQSFVHFVTGIALGGIIYMITLLTIGRQKLVVEVKALLAARKK